MFTAFYDLAVAPPAFNFLTFMNTAEIVRRRQGDDAVSLVIVPGPKDGFRDDNLPPDLPERRRRLHNLIMSGARLMPGLKALTLAEDREAAQRLFLRAAGNVFPRGYHPMMPVAEYKLAPLNAAFLRGEMPFTLSAPEDRLELVADYLHHVAGGRRPITITLREAGFHPTKNSDLGVWRQFVAGLDHSVYCPIIIRDTERMNEPLEGFDGAVACPLAAFDMCFRSAIYQLAHDNLFVNNGPQVSALFTNAPGLFFKQLNPDTDATTEAWLRNEMGVLPGLDWAMAAKRHRFVWEPEDAEVISRHFHAHMAELDAGLRGAAGEERHGIQTPEQGEVVASHVLNWLKPRLANACDEDMATLVAIAERYPALLGEE